MSFSYNAVWSDTLALLRAHASTLLAIAGAFLFLPALLTSYFLPPPEEAQNFAEMVEQLFGYMRETWHWSLLANIANMVGALSIYMLLLDPQGRTVGGVIGGSAVYLPSYLVLQIVQFVIVCVGLLLLIVPGLYLLGRLAPSGAVMVAERRLNPFTALARSFELTRSKGWSVAGLVLLVAIAGVIAMFAVQAVLGSIFLLAGGREGVGRLLVAVLESGLAAVFSVVIGVLLVAVYRALRGDDPDKVFS